MKRSLVMAALLAGCAQPIAPADGGSDASATDAPVLDAGNDAPDPLEARATAVLGYVGEEVSLDATPSIGATEYEWWPGDGRRLARGTDPVARVTYTDEGHYTASLLVYDASGNRRTASVLVSIVRRPVFTPRQSSSVTAMPDGRLVIVSPDSDEIAIFDTALASAPSHVTVCDHPRSVAAYDDAHVAVACDHDARLALVTLEGGAVSYVPLPYASHPFGVMALDAHHVAVSLEATGQLGVVDVDARSVQLLDALPDARALALLPDGRVVVSRLRSPDTGGELVVVDLSTGARTPITLAVDPQIASDTEIGGVPTYLSSIAVSPDGTRMAVVGLQASLDEGTYRSGRPLRFDTAIRALVVSIDVATLTENVARRRQLDNRGFASAVTFSARGDFVYVATRGNRTIERIDVLRDVASGDVQDVGLALQGLALTSDGVAVDAFRSRAIVRVLDVPGTGLRMGNRAQIVATEPLDPAVARGGQLFDDSADPRLTADGYIACAHCHLDGLEDHRVWDFTDRGEGLRNTIELVGRAGASPIHWSANFDEVQDFEGDIRNAFGGTGLLSDADWATHTTSLGPPRGGLSADLDSLAAYVRSLDTFQQSPHRNPDGTLTDAAVRGRVTFHRADVGCASCHEGSILTDSQWLSPGVPLLEHVNTIGPGSGMRLGAPLTGIDTPTLHGVWGTAPYLHDGSAATLHEVLIERNAGDWHGYTHGLSPAEIDDLIEYLLELDGRTD